jgi:hypothetical protein
LNKFKLSSRCFNSSRINSYSHSINSYSVNQQLQAVVSAATTLPAAAAALQDTTNKTATTE